MNNVFIPVNDKNFAIASEGGDATSNEYFSEMAAEPLGEPR